MNSCKKYEKFRYSCTHHFNISYLVYLSFIRIMCKNYRLFKKKVKNSSFTFQRKLLDVSLGFAAGVMIAASYWSLLAPAIEMAAESKVYGDEGEFAFIPVGLGFLVGAAFVYGTDVLISSLGIQSPNVLLAMQSVGTKNRRRVHEKLKSDEDLHDNDVISGVEITGGKMYTNVESTTIDGIGIIK